MGSPTKSIVILLLIFLHGFLHAQNVEISLGNTEIGIKEPFTISLHFPKDRKKDFHNFPYYGFPEIEGLLKDRTVYSQEKDKNFIITQYYIPTKAGEFHLTPFAFSINGKLIASPGTTVYVVLNHKADSASTLIIKTDKEYKESRISSFLTLSVNKDVVYNGQGFLASLYVYTPLSNKTEMTFINLSEQFAGLVKKMKPVNCWAEDLDRPASTQIDTISIKGEKFKRWNIYGVLLYPIDTLPIIFPKLSLDIIKYSVAEDPKLTTVFRKPELYTFYSEPAKVNVRPLPPHPLRDNVPVGEFKLKEKVNHTHIQAGKSCNYSLFIQGEGNITSIANPILKENSNLEFYPPEATQSIDRDNYPLSGTKEFNYYIIPQEPGRYKLKDFISFIYFNPLHKTYDTLFPRIELIVEGESRQNSFISSYLNDPFYKNIDKVSNKLKDYKEDESTKFFANIIILFMLVTTVFLMLRK